MQISNRFVIACNFRIIIRIHKLNDLKFEVLPEDFVLKLEEPPKPLTIITKCSILDVAAVLDPPLATVNSCGKRSSELCVLVILSTNKHFYHYYCVIFTSKYI